MVLGEAVVLLDLKVGKMRIGVLPLLHTDEGPHLHVLLQVVLDVRVHK